MTYQSFKTKVAVSVMILLAVTCSAGSNQSFKTRVAAAEAYREGRGQIRKQSAEDLGFYLTRREMPGLFEPRMVDYFLAGIDRSERKRHAELARLAIQDTPNAPTRLGEASCAADDECGPDYYCDHGVCRPLPREGNGMTSAAIDGNQVARR